MSKQKIMRTQEIGIKEGMEAAEVFKAISDNPVLAARLEGLNSVGAVVTTNSTGRVHIELVFSSKDVAMNKMAKELGINEYLGKGEKFTSKEEDLNPKKEMTAKELVQEILSAANTKKKDK